MTTLSGASGEAYTLCGPPRVGGEAAVYPAIAASDGRRLAIRVDRVPSAPSDAQPSVGDRSRRILEGPAGAAVPVVWDRGRWEDRDFLVLEWYEHILDDWAGRAPVSARRRAALALVTAVAALHEAGEVHGDIKPANVAILDDGAFAVLLDLAEIDRLPLTPRFAAPERARGRPPTAAADRWSVGLTVAEAALARACAAPLRAEDVMALDAVAPGLGAAVAGLVAPSWRRARDLSAIRAALAGRRADLSARWGAFAAGAVAGLGTLGALVAMGPSSASLRDPLARPPRCPAGFTADGRACAHPDGRRVVFVPPGRFTMGTDAPGDSPAHDVAITRGFWLGDAEVTQAEWRALAGSDPVRDRSQILGVDRLELPCASWHGASLVGDALPVVCVNFFEVVRWLNARSERDGLAPAYRVEEGAGSPTVVWDRDADGWRLPTEAEWEWAARGAGRPAAWQGDACAANVRDASAAERWGGEAPCDDGHPALGPVRAYPPSPLGLFDLQGNAMEWVWDRYGDLPRWETTDPAGPPTGIARARRGGSWNHVPRGPEGRYGAPATRHNFVTGFRVARSAR